MTHFLEKYFCLNKHSDSSLATKKSILPCTSIALIVSLHTKKTILLCLYSTQLYLQVILPKKKKTIPTGKFH